MSVETVVVHHEANGRTWLEWPEGWRTTEISRDLLEQLVNEGNDLRAENEGLRAKIVEWERYYRQLQPGLGEEA